MTCTCLPEVADPFCPTDGTNPARSRPDVIERATEAFLRSRYVLPVTVTALLATMIGLAIL